jgi:hypothetical protein
MANVAYMFYSVFIYATLTTLKVLERDQINFAYYFFFILSIQFLGFGLAGMEIYIIDLKIFYLFLLRNSSSIFGLAI